MKPKTYEIRSLGDFLKVPPDRLKACLKEFEIAINMNRSVSRKRGINVIDVKYFNWTDDDRADLTLSYFPEGQE